jgi:hypothetical protein
MYLTSHRIRTDDGHEGINTFLHMTGHQDDPGSRLAIIDIEPGTLVAAHCDVAPGRNQVLCYLDIVAPDETTAADLRTLRSTGRMFLDGEPNQIPFQISSGSAVMRLGCTIGHHRTQRHITDYDLLWNSALQVLTERPVPPWLGQANPLTIVQQQIGDQLVYMLDDSSLSRVQTLKGPHWLRRRFSVDLFDKIDVEQMQGDITPSIITSITGLELEQLAQMGGVKIIHSRTGHVIAQYP